MRNASATVLEPTSVAHRFQRQNPDGDFAVTYVNTRSGLYSGQIDIDQIDKVTAGVLADMTDGAFVIVRGTIGTVRIFRNEKKPVLPPTAMFVLSSGSGAHTLVHVSWQAYERVWGWLVKGRPVSVSGNLVRSEPGDPGHIVLSRLLITGADVVTREQYAAAVKA